MTLRILIVGPYPPPYGGIASQIANTVPYLVQAGFERVHVISWANQSARVEQGHVITERVRLSSKLLLWGNPLNWKAALSMIRFGIRHRLPLFRIAVETTRAIYVRHTVREGAYHIVHYFMLTEGFVAPSLRAAAPGLKQVITIYGEIFDMETFFSGQGALVGEELAAIDHHMSSSRYCASSIEMLGLSSDRVEPLYYGVDLERFSPLNDHLEFRRAAGIAENATLVFYFARLMAEMGADVVADVIPEVLAMDETVVFLIAGADGECVPRFQEMERTFPGRVHLRVDVPGSDVPKMYAACDMLLAPTREQHACMGMSIKEAMATGRVGICSRSGGIPEAVIDGETGVLLPTGPDLRVRPDDMAAAILDMARDPERRLKMGRAARNRAEQMFDNRQTAARLVEIYRGLAAE